MVFVTARVSDVERFNDAYAHMCHGALSCPLYDVRHYIFGFETSICKKRMVYNSDLCICITDYRNSLINDDEWIILIIFQDKFDECAYE